MRVHATAHEEVAAHLTPGRLAQRLVDTKLVETGAAFEMEIVQAGPR